MKLYLNPTLETKLNYHRRVAGITQEELADAVGVTRQTIIAIEKGNYQPSVLLALKLASHFKLRVEDLFAINSDK